MAKATNNKTLWTIGIWLAGIGFAFKIIDDTSEIFAMLSTPLFFTGILLVLVSRFMKNNNKRNR